MTSFLAGLNDVTSIGGRGGIMDFVTTVLKPYYKKSVTMRWGGDVKNYQNCMSSFMNDP